ncbi:MAG: AAA family ATPase [Steroidobacteraceae bacterium]
MSTAPDIEELRARAAEATSAPRENGAAVQEPPPWMDEGPEPEEPHAGGERKPEQRKQPTDSSPVIEPLQIEAASTWASRPEPAPRDWIIEGLIPAGRVTSLLGNGGLGKTLIAVQLGVHVAINRAIFGKQVSGGPVLGIFCEDEAEELERRARAACAGEDIGLDSLDQLYMTSRDGQDNLLCTFEREQILATKFYGELEATIASIKPRLTILDTAADMFGGDFMSTPQVRQFIKVALGGLCVRHETAILLLAHPSASAMATGDGGGFSTAWHNSVRSRMYLRRPKTENPEEAKDRRVLEVRKSNYAGDGGMVPLIYQRGYFVPDTEPVDEGAKPGRARSSGCTKLGLALMAHMRQNAASGQVVSFGTLFEALQGAGDIERGPYETVRKPLQRTLRQLVHENLLIATEVPRGYRVASEPAEAP